MTDKLDCIFHSSDDPISEDLAIILVEERLQCSRVSVDVRFPPTRCGM